MLLNDSDKARIRNRGLLSLGAGLLQAGAPRVGAPGPGMGAALQGVLAEMDRTEGGLLNRKMASAQMAGVEQTQQMNAAKIAAQQAAAERQAAADRAFLGDGEASQGLLTDPRRRALYQADPAAFIKGEASASGQKPIFQKKPLPGGKVQEVVSYDNGRSFQPFGSVYDRRDPYIQATAPGPNGGVITNVIPRADLDRRISAEQPDANGVRSFQVGGKANTTRLTEHSKAINTIDAMGTSLNNYTSLVKSYGSQILPGGKKLELQAAHRDLMLEAKELYNLGVLNGPDLTLMESVILDPTSMKGAFYEAIGGKKVFDQQLQTIRTKLKSARDRADRLYGDRKPQKGRAVAAPVKRLRYENGKFIPQ